MSEVGYILSRTPSNMLSVNVQKLTKNVAEASAAVADGFKFESRAKLEHAGLDRKYDELQGALARANIYETTIPLATSKLSTKQQALDDIRTIITDFQGATSNITSVAGTRAEQANKALEKLAVVLNRQDSGKYIFGGRVGNKPPVSGDITTLTDQNFTNVTSNEVLVPVSDAHSVDVDMVTARDMAPFIQALNLYKNGSGPIYDAQVWARMSDAIKNHESLQVQVGDAVKDIEAATIENANVVASVKDVMDSEFTMNIVEEAAKLQGATHSLLASFSITAGIGKLFDKVMNLG